MARTAVVAGTASAVAGSVSARQQRQVAADAPADGRTDAGAATERMIAQLTQLASLRDQGVLTDDEFELQKARLLA